MNIKAAKKASKASTPTPINRTREQSRSVGQKSPQHERSSYLSEEINHRVVPA